MNKIGKKTPVWHNLDTGEVACGNTLNEALGVGYAFIPSSAWERAYALPVEERVVIARGMKLPRNAMTLAIAKQAKRRGELECMVLGKARRVEVLYADQVRVIVEG